MSKNRQKSSRDTALRKRRRDPAYASAMPWNWKLCRECENLVPLSCPKCGGTRFTSRPLEIIKAGLRKHGYPPALHRNS